jgi:predicted GTPase
MGTTGAMIPWMEDITKNMEAYEKNINESLKGNELDAIQLGDNIRIVKQQISTAKNKFTMAFVGEYNSGKSTIINTLLDLDENEKLSSQDSPDTALSTRIMYKDNGLEYDAEIIYKPGTYETERVDWETAKKYTSHVETEKDLSLADKVAQIDEVRYYVHKDILSVCNILDLPGTGAGRHEDDDKLTERKIYEADVVFWVVSTSSEADKNAVANLEKISSKIIPIINVWQFEQEGISGEFTAEETLQDITGKYSVYFSKEEPPIVYYAKEIEYAQQYGMELKEEWGKGRFADCLHRIVYSESMDIEQEKIARIKENIKKALKNTLGSIEDKKEKLTARKDEIDHGTSELEVIETSLYSTYQSVNAKLKDLSKTKANDIIQYLTGLTDAFIEDQMQSANVTMLIRSVGRGRKERLQKEMQEKYNRDYLKLEDKPCWYDDILEEYVDEVKIMLDGEYASFKIKARNAAGASDKELPISSEFISTVIEQNMQAFMQSLSSLFLTGIAAIVLVVMPGGEIIDSISISLLGKSSIGADRITSKKENIKTRARLQINMQKIEIARKIESAGKNINEECQKQIEKQLSDKKTESDKKREVYDKAKRQLEEFAGLLDEYICETENY